MTTIYTVNNKVLKNVATDKWLTKKEAGPGPVDPYNPLGLPPFTIRCKFSSGYTPDMGDSQTLVDAGENIWDITRNDTDWSELLSSNQSLLSVLGANTTDIERMWSLFNGCMSLTSVSLFDTSSVINTSSMFGSCTSLTAVPLFDLSNVEYANNMFASCESLTSVPLFDTSKATTMECMFTWCTSLSSIPLFDTTSCTNMDEMFRKCFKVESGALALYQQASSQGNVTSHTSTFQDCGIDSVTGAAELAQIPSSWGGTGS